MATPDWDTWLASAWGPGFETSGAIPILAAASNLVFGTNPQYTIQDFFTMYPKFGGAPLKQNTTATVDSVSVSVDTANIAVGNPVSDSAGLFPNGTVVASVGSGMIALSKEASADGATVLTIWNATLIPAVVIGLYVALASSCLVQARWLDSWKVGMGLFIAHFLTLYARSDGNPLSTIGQVAAQGLSLGIQTAKAVGDVSVSYQPVTGLDEWGMWNLTIHGEQFAQFAKMIGSGPVFLY